MTMMTTTTTMMMSISERLCEFIVRGSGVEIWKISAWKPREFGH
jgi:hypothetical protein